MKIISSLFIIGLIFISMVLPGFLGFRAKASTEIPLSEVEAAINLGIEAVKQAIKPLENTGSYIMPDHPSPTISIKYNGTLYVPGSFLDPGDTMYKTELVEVTSNSIAWRYYFNVDEDEDYDVVIYGRLTNIDENRDKLTINIEKSEYKIDLYVGTRDAYKFYGVEQDFNTFIYINTELNRGIFMSSRYVARHSTQLAGWLMYEEGEYGLSQGLLMTMETVGFWYDVYDPIWGKSNSYPDDYWDYKDKTWLANGYDAHPWELTGSLISYPYKSRMYIFDNLNLFNTALRGWQDAPLYSLLKAIHLLNKYGTSKQAEAEQLIEHALWEGQWDGYGLSRAKLDPHWIMTGVKDKEQITYSYKGYPVYLNSVLLIALIRYYEVTGDAWIGNNNILNMADRLAGILTRIQWKYEETTPWGKVKLALFKGWWPAAYDIGSYVLKPSAWGILDTATSIGDTIAGILASLDIDVGSGFLPMPSEWPFAIVNSESTILAIKALKVYLAFAQEYGREPLDVADLRIGGGAEFVESGGGCNPCGYKFRTYNIFHEADPHGIWLKSYVLSDLSDDAWAYSYSKYKVYVGELGTYKIVIGLQLHYYLRDGYGNKPSITIVVKLFNSYGEVINQWENVVVEYDDEGSVSGVISIEYGFEPDILSAGTYYIEVGIKSYVDSTWYHLIPAISDGYAIIDYIKIIEQ